MSLQFPPSFKHAAVAGMALALSLTAPLAAAQTWPAKPHRPHSLRFQQSSQP